MAFSERWGPGAMAPMGSLTTAVSRRKVRQIPQPAPGLSGPGDQKIAFDAAGHLFIAELGSNGGKPEFCVPADRRSGPTFYCRAAYGDDQPHLDVGISPGTCQDRRTRHGSISCLAMSSRRNLSANGGANMADVGVGDILPFLTERPGSLSLRTEVLMSFIRPGKVRFQSHYPDRLPVILKMPIFASNVRTTAVRRGPRLGLQEVRSTDPTRCKPSSRRTSATRRRAKWPGLAAAMRGSPWTQGMVMYTRPMSAEMPRDSGRFTSPARPTGAEPDFDTRHRWNSPCRIPGDRGNGQRHRGDPLRRLRRFGAEHDLPAPFRSLPRLRRDLDGTRSCRAWIRARSATRPAASCGATTKA